MKLESEVRREVKRITDRFLRLGKPTLVHEIKTKLGPKRGVLGYLIQERVIRQVGGNYLPCLCAVMEFEHPDLQKLCFECTQMVLRALRWLYEQNGEQKCTVTEVSNAVQQRYPLADNQVIAVGVLFATDFTDCLSGWTYDSGGFVDTLTVAEGILDFENVESAWQNELDRRTARAEKDKSATLLSPLEKGARENPADLDSVLRVYNRGRFDRDLATLSAEANSGSPLSMVMVDTDRFKHVNDSFGHQAGDEVLRTIASVLRSSCAGKGLCYRYGGDEFAILLRNYSAEEAVALAERVRATVEQAAFEQSPDRVTASIGVATYPSTTERSDDLVSRADAAMYVAKKAGGNQVHIS